MSETGTILNGLAFMIAQCVGWIIVSTGNLTRFIAIITSIPSLFVVISNLMTEGGMEE